MAELYGSGKRRWVPDGGLQKHREKIHRESKIADHKNLPFTFSKPPRRTGFSTFECEECGCVMSLPKNTVMVICSTCNDLRNEKSLI